ASAAGADNVVVARDHAPYGRRRDEAVANSLRAIGVSFAGVGSAYAVAPGTVVKGDGNPYAVFTPFFRAWLATGHPPPVERADVTITTSGLDSDGIPDEPAIGCRLPTAGEDAALNLWRHF